MFLALGVMFIMCRTCRNCFGLSHDRIEGAFLTAAVVNLVLAMLVNFGFALTEPFKVCGGNYQVGQIDEE